MKATKRDFTHLDNSIVELLTTRPFQRDESPGRSLTIPSFVTKLRHAVGGVIDVGNELDTFVQV